MFGKSSLKLSFSMMLAVELLRAEMQKLYGGGIKFFYCDVEAGKVNRTDKGDKRSLTETEIYDLSRDWSHHHLKERIIRITALVGPLGPLFSPTFKEDRRRKLARVEADCRLFSTETGCIWWKPHYIGFSVRVESEGQLRPSAVIYESGRCFGLHHRGTAISTNPCQEMCDSQTGANYARLHHQMNHLE